MKRRKAASRSNRCDQLNRRTFMSLLGGATATWPLAARAQQAGKLRTIGFLGADASTFSPFTAAFVARLRELGWIEGRSVTIEFRWAEARSERYAEMAAEFVRLKVDVIITVGTAASAAKQATAVIPIVFAVAADPVGSGLVASLARPGGNVTGLSLQQPDAAGKRLEFLRGVLPDFRRLAIIANVGYPAAVLDMNEVQVASLQAWLSQAATRPVFSLFEYGISVKWLEFLKEIAPGVTRAAVLRDAIIPGGRPVRRNPSRGASDRSARLDRHPGGPAQTARGLLPTLLCHERRLDLLRP